MWLHFLSTYHTTKKLEPVTSNWVVLHWIHYCLAKELARRKKCLLSVTACLRACVPACLRAWSVIIELPLHGYRQLILVIESPLCQTSCPLRTVHCLYELVCRMKNMGIPQGYGFRSTRDTLKIYRGVSWSPYIRYFILGPSTNYWHRKKLRFDESKRVGWVTPKIARLLRRDSIWSAKCSRESVSRCINKYP